MPKSIRYEKSPQADTPPIELISVLLFIGLVIAEHALLLAYKMSYAGYLLPSKLPVGDSYASLIPYFWSRTDPIPTHVVSYIAIYYTLSVGIIISFMILCFFRRMKPISIKGIIILIAALILVLLPWLYGWALNRSDMSHFHQGEILGHFGYMNAILLVIGIGSAAVFGLRRSV